MTSDPVNKLIETRIKQNCLRKLRPAAQRQSGSIEIAGKSYHDFCSNDYLGLSGHNALKLAAQEAISHYGSSSGASRLLSGDYELFHQLETAIARLKNKPAALALNSGYQANVGVLSALCGGDDIIIADKLSHASIIDGAAQSRAKLLRFRHNDINHLETMLGKSGGSNSCRRVVITESVFSMDGDIAPLAEIAALKQKYDFTLIVDEAHATGVFGENGGGLCSNAELAPHVDIIIGTFGKALGSFGAYVACSEKLKTFLINTCRSFIYSTALPPSVIAVNIAAIKLLESEPQRRQDLLQKSHIFRQSLKAAGLNVLGKSQIIPVILPEKILDSAAEKLRQQNYWVLPIKPPTIPAGSSRLRFSLSYDHSEDTLSKLTNSIIAISTESRND